MKKLGLFVLFTFFTSGIIFSQSVENITAKIENSKVVIGYDLIGNASTTYYVQIYTSFDNYAKPLTYVTGDAGKGVKVGKYKVVYWDYVAENSELSGDINITIIPKDENLQKVVALSLKNSAFFINPQIRKGYLQTLTWSHYDPNKKINIELYKNGQLVRVIANNISNVGFFNWYITTDYSNSANYQLRVIEVNNNSEFVFSNYFALLPKKNVATKVVNFLTGISLTSTFFFIMFFALV